VLEALRALHVPVLRWPGGCFADEYHWKNGIGPRELRPTMVNTHWGGVTENNHFGTHEFLRLCELLGAEPYICGNLGSGSVQEMAEWVEYMTFAGKSPMADLRRSNGREEPFRLKYFGVGNESWGCGGAMRPEHYADEFRRYNVFCRDFGTERLYRIACGSYETNYHWTEVLMKEAVQFPPFGEHRHMQGLSFHYYTILRGADGKPKPATGFTPEDYYATMREALKIDDMLRMHGAIMDRTDPERKVGLIVDEWGTWHEVEPGSNPGFLYMRSTMRDAMVAALTLHVFHQHRERVHMANIAQVVNVLQAVVLTEGDRMLRTPTYHVFEMFSGHQEAELLDLKLEDRWLEPAGSGASTPLPAVSASASRADDGSVLFTLANLSLEAAETMRILLPETLAGCAVVDARELRSTGAIDADNTFDSPDAISPRPLEGVGIVDGWLVVPLAPMSVASVRLVPSTPRT
jgi:alpha-N-arabinofuranosidase